MTEKQDNTSALRLSDGLCCKDIKVTELIQNKADLIAYLTTKELARKEPPKSVYVTAALRKLIMTDETQGRFVHNGLVKEFKFESIGGGVYMASIVNDA
jgi:hypothetical protein